jgi:hypothetical protein
MVKTWNTVFSTGGQAWGIPQNHITQLINDEGAAQTILDKVKSGERTAADVVQCNMVFKDLEAEARFIKKHYLMKEPLSGDELLHYRFTRRKKEMVDFEALESGMTACFCARYENQKGEHGAWGAVVLAIIP